MLAVEPFDDFKQERNLRICIEKYWSAIKMRNSFWRRKRLKAPSFNNLEAEWLGLIGIESEKGIGFEQETLADLLWEKKGTCNDFQYIFQEQELV